MGAHSPQSLRIRIRRGRISWGAFPPLEYRSEGRRRLFFQRRIYTPSGIDQYLVMIFSATSQYYLENSLLTIQTYFEDKKMQQRLLNSLFSLDAEHPNKIFMDYSGRISELLEVRNSKYYSNDEQFIP